MKILRTTPASWSLLLALAIAACSGPTTTTDAGTNDANTTSDAADAARTDGAGDAAANDATTTDAAMDASALDAGSDVASMDATGSDALPTDANTDDTSVRDTGGGAEGGRADAGRPDIECGPRPPDSCVAGGGGLPCGDVLTEPMCVAGSWVCGEGMIFASQCTCIGRPPCSSAVCTATGWSCPDGG